jgi:hypothetical protein
MINPIHGHFICATGALAETVAPGTALPEKYMFPELDFDPIRPYRDGRKIMFCLFRHDHQQPL